VVSILQHPDEPENNYYRMRPPIALLDNDQALLDDDHDTATADDGEKEEGEDAVLDALANLTVADEE
jgi:hypothetical protein